MNDIILFAHPTFGVLGIMASVWILVEALNASEANQGRIRMAAYAVTALHRRSPGFSAATGTSTTTTPRRRSS